MHDFAVVGAGPAGSRFARRAAEEGYDVVVFEQGEVGKPLACSGHVSRDIWEFTPEGAKDELLQNEITGARFHVGGPHSRAYTFYKQEVVSNVIDRVGLDKLLADAAREAGADLREAHTVTAVEETEDRVELTVRGPEETHEVEAKMVVGCDGPTSRVRKELGLPDPGELLHGVLGFDPEPDHEDRVDVHLTAPRFFAWRIPRGEAGVEYGLAAPPNREKGARELFDELTAGYDVNTVDFCSGAIPIGPAETVTSQRGLLIGDAAAQTKPFTGGGILYGMTSADYAVENVDPDDPDSLQAYEDAWRADLGREMRMGHWLRRGYNLPAPIQRAGLWTLQGEIGVHMDRPTSFFSREHFRKLLSR